MHIKFWLDDLNGGDELTPRRRWKDNIKINLKERRCEDVR
jgi:hypothetical protein